MPEADDSQLLSFGLPPDALAVVFPFHVLIDHDLKVLQCGRSLRKVLPGLRLGCRLDEVLTFERPGGPFDFATLREARGQIVLLRGREKQGLLPMALG